MVNFTRAEIAGLMRFTKSKRERMVTEDTVEEYLRKRVEALRGKALKMMGLTGWPDRLVLLPGGVVVFVELKRPKGGKFEPMQPHVLRWLKNAGFNVYVIRTKEQVDAMLEEAYPC